MVDFSVVFLCVIFSIGCAQLNVVKRKFVTTKDGRIIPNSTTVIQQMTPSPAVCASFCSIQEICCCASYDTKTMQCNLDESCCPESELSADALMLTKSKVSFSCPNRWLNYENKCFFFSEEEKTWNDAMLTCEHYKSRLVEVSSSCENDFLKMTATAYGKYETQKSDLGNTYWLGGSDRQSEGYWIWVCSLTKFIFTDWFAGEPSNGNGENCVRMSLENDFKWGDTYCGTKLRFICEKKVE